MLGGHLVTEDRGNSQLSREEALHMAVYMVLQLHLARMAFVSGWGPVAVGSGVTWDWGNAGHQCEQCKTEVWHKGYRHNMRPQGTMWG